VPKTRRSSWTGSYLSQFGSVSIFKYPNGIAIDNSGNSWVVDGYNRHVQEFNSSGTYLNQLGTNNTHHFPDSNLYGIAFNSGGNLWMANGSNVQEYNTSGTSLSQFGVGGSGNGQFNGSQGVAIDASGNIWVADKGNNRVQEFNSSGMFLLGIGSGYNGVSGTIGSTGNGPGQLNTPEGIAIH